MNVTLVMVQSVDGIIAPASHIGGWISPEDADHFNTIKSRGNVLIMGRNTYDTVKSSIAPSSTLRRIVLTHHPEQYAADTIPGEIEFSSESPHDLIERLTSEGYSSLILAGGSITNREFLEHKLISDCLITVEPRLFGQGTRLFDTHDADVNLRLIDSKVLNAQGTLVLHYQILYDH